MYSVLIWINHEENSPFCHYVYKHLGIIGGIFKAIIYPAYVEFEVKMKSYIIIEQLVYHNKLRSAVCVGDGFYKEMNYVISSVFLTMRINARSTHCVAIFFFPQLNND